METHLLQRTNILAMSKKNLNKNAPFTDTTEVLDFAGSKNPLMYGNKSPAASQYTHNIINKSKRKSPFYSHYRVFVDFAGSKNPLLYGNTSPAASKKIHKCVYIHPQGKLTKERQEKLSTLQISDFWTERERGGEKLVRHTTKKQTDGQTKR